MDLNEDDVFNMFRTEEDHEKLSVSKFLTALRRSGLSKRDPRLRLTMHELEALRKNLRRRLSMMMSDASALAGDAKAEKDTISESSQLAITREEFKQVLGGSRLLITRALTKQLIVPEFDSFMHEIHAIYLKCKGNNGGKVADYIPQLAAFSPDYFGVCVCTVDGQRASWGDTKIPFSIQSASKPLNYVIALNDLGSEHVHKHVGREPSGRLFNEICLDTRNKPHNPCINAGAIVTVNLVKPELSQADRFQHLIDTYRKLAGNERVQFSNSTFLSERDTADRNFALAYFMRENKALPRNVPVENLLEFYFQMCSVEVDCEAAAVIAGTLANGGICPMTGEKVLQNKSDVQKVLQIMYSCGMYDYSGQFAFKVGLAAKSGVSGVLLIVVPGVMGIATWSPPLDRMGNSVRGVQFCTELVEKFSFHKFDSLQHTGGKIDPRWKDENQADGQKLIHALFCAAKGEIESLKRYIIQGVDINKGDYDGRTMLHLAASEGNEDVIQFLLDSMHAIPNPKDRFGHTPLDDAYDFGHQDCYDLLKPHYTEDEYKHHGPKVQKRQETIDLYPQPESADSKPRKVMFAADGMTDSGIELPDGGNFVSLSPGVEE